MRLSWVELRDYRNHVHTRVDMGHDGVIVVAGANGEGKTNLLEAMHFLYSLGSPRVSARGRTSSSAGGSPRWRLWCSTRG